MINPFIPERYINPITDFGFKRLFGTESNKDLLIDFLNAIIGLKKKEAGRGLSKLVRHTRI